MKKISVLLGLGLLGMLMLSFTTTNMNIDPKTETLKITDIAYIEENEEFNLGFDTSEYLPWGFNAYEGMEFDLEEIAFIEDEEEIEVPNHLPENFRAVSK